MNKEEIIELFSLYGFLVMGSDKRGNFAMEVEQALKIFDKYGQDYRRYEIEVKYGMTVEEYEEYERLYDRETASGSILCSGENKNGTRCINSTVDLNMIEPKKALKLLRQKHYCKKHKYQEKQLYIKAKKAIS